jgi:hypothetical protein
MKSQLFAVAAHQFRRALPTFVLDVRDASFPESGGERDLNIAIEKFRSRITEQVFGCGIAHKGSAVGAENNDPIFRRF